MAKATTECRVYLACLACYNAGRLVGEWVDGEDAEDFDIGTMDHGADDPCPHEELAIHDHEGFGEWRPGENESLADVSAVARLMGEHGEAFSAWYANGNATGKSVSEWGDAFSEDYRGTYKSLADYAEELSEELGDLESVPERLRYHIDWESVAREMEMGGDVWTADVSDGVAVFWNS